MNCLKHCNETCVKLSAACIWFVGREGGELVGIIPTGWGWSHEWGLKFGFYLFNPLVEIENFIESHLGPSSVLCWRYQLLHTFNSLPSCFPLQLTLKRSLTGMICLKFINWYLWCVRIGAIEIHNYNIFNSSNKSGTSGISFEISIAP